MSSTSTSSILESSGARGPGRELALQIGLTGSIGMGKSTLASQFNNLGFPVFDADAAVHKMYSNGGSAVKPIEHAFPGVVVDGVVDRKELGARVLSDSAAMALLEEIVHPLVQQDREVFLREMSELGHFLVIYDIPLLYEKPSTAPYVDYTIVASSDADIQRQRVLNRPGMTTEKFESILSKQMSDEKKRKLADYVINTNSDHLAPAKSQIAKVLESIIEKQPDRWNIWKSRHPDRITDAKTDLINIRDAFDAVVFDLDDTLCPVMGPVMGAVELLDELIHEKMPLTKKNLGDEYKNKLREAMMRISKEEPMISHDLTTVRTRAFHEVVHDTEREQIEILMNQFIAKRSDVENHLYDDVIPCFEWLAGQGIKIGVLTNGNANLTDSSISRYFSQELIIGAPEVGAMKPSPVGFISVLQRGNFVPRRVLYVGDSFDKDVLGSMNVGMVGAIISREGVEGIPIENESEQGSKYIALSSLDPAEMEQKILSFLAR